MKIIILGAGPCGLGAAYHLNKLGHTDWQLFERDSHVGGLSASFRDDAGFTWQHEMTDIDPDQKKVTFSNGRIERLLMGNEERTLNGAAG
jgi:protoporphyrinogen oxidase